MNTGTESLEGALQSAFVGEDAPPKARAVEPEAPVEDLETEAEAPAEEGDEAPVEEAAAEEAPDETAAPLADPEYEIEVSGQRHVIKGHEQVKELLQKGLDYSQKTEQLARAQEGIVARAQLLQLQDAFQREVAGDIAELKAIDGYLDQFTKMDWSKAFDEDPFQALKLREQRDALREQRNAKLQELNQKQDMFKQGQAQASSQLLASENAAMLAKIPEWRNSEKAAAEKSEIGRLLIDRYGYQPAEVAQVLDHRMIVAARDLLAYHKLQSAKSERVKQARTAPPVVKPGSTQQAKPNANTEFTKVRAHLRKLGGQGNHKAQEALVTKMLTDTFK